MAGVGNHGAVKVRDVWRQKDLGTADGKYTVKVPKHGVVMLRLSKP